ncbi:response regulator [Paenibacillus sp. YYML68]|uniref:response regulator n=1 Tax=Paenibacillus sp. YYML68 TaxID=2909250 RepID=UPI002490CA7A|nr:response regulator [Paenibacillus sp. YYML68]
MYKLLLVEDEEDVREGIVQEIDWAAYGFEIVDTAENGKEAMELVERWAPDVVVTDIRMPFMDGLALSAWLREQYPAIRIIILTGFDEFEYAQKAIRLHIDEYVLKPFSAQELIDVLLRIKLKIDEDTDRMKNLHTLEEHYRQSLPVLREVFLSSLVTHKLPRQQVTDKAASYELDLDAQSYAVSVISIDKPDENGNERADIIGRNSLKYSQNMELKAFAALNISGEIVTKHQLGLIFVHHSELVVLSMCRSGSPEQLLPSTLAVLEEIRQSIEKYLKLTVTIGVGTVRYDVTELSYSYKDAVRALDYRLVLGGNRLIYIGDVESRHVDKLVFDELKEQSLIRCLKVGTLQEIQSTVHSLFDELTDAHVSVKDCHIYLLELLTAVLKAAKDARADLDAIFGADFSPLAELHRLANLQEARGWMLGLCTRLTQSIASDRQSSYSSLVEQAKAFTLTHYHDSDISIHKVCGHLHISAGYFSSIFKKETKLTFGAYLMHIRMEAAKELLRTTDMKAFEIAEKVGYTEPNYFSFCFRKHVGISPKEYRAAVEGGSS